MSASAGTAAASSVGARNTTGCAAHACASAAAKSRQVGYRSAGDFASAVPMTWLSPAGRSARISVTIGGGASSCAHSSAMLSSLVYGGLPHSISTTVQASAYWSARPSARCPWICSGDT